MAKKSESVSFYFFDFDDNIMFLSTKIFIRNTTTGEEKALTTGDYAWIHPLLGRPGEWGDWAEFPGTFRDFRDISPAQAARGRKQPFVRDVEAAIAGDPASWKGPSWDLFVHACDKQRPAAIITARGHAPDTIKAGVRVLVEHKLIPSEPDYLAVFPVGNDDLRREELDDARLTMTIPALKKVAIIASVERALARHGSAPAHRFGMSDDDPDNVNLIIRAMTVCKLKHPDKRFFVINTHFDQMVKLEVFPVAFPVTSTPAAGAVVAGATSDPLS